MSENATAIELDELIPPEPLDVGGPDISDAESYVFEMETERTVAFFADPRATSLLLEETLGKLIESLDIQRALVDISTVVGVTIARVFQDAGLPFEVLEFGQGDHYREGASDLLPVVKPETADTRMMAPAMRNIAAGNVSRDAGQLREAAAGTHEIHVDDLGVIDANVLLIPAMVGPDEKLLDFSTGSLLGSVIGQLENAKRDFLLIDAPERGLRAMADGTYQRSIVHIEPPNADE